MGRVKLSATRKRSFHRHRNPVAERHILRLQVRCQMKCPLRHVVYENRSSGLEHPHRFIDPTKTPVQVVI